MEKKKLLTLLLTLLIAVIAVAILIINVFDIHFNVITYHSFDQDGYSFIFKGSSSTVRKIVIKKDGKKLCSLPFDSNDTVFSSEFGYSARFMDINNDGKEDLLLPCQIDSDGDIHSTVYLADDSKGFIYNEELRSLSNLSLSDDKAVIYTEETVKEIIAEETKSSPEFYIRRHIIAKYEFINGDFIALEERAIIYYSENDYYCYSVYKYSEEYGELIYDDEKWFEPDEIDEYPLNWDK